MIKVNIKILTWNMMQMSAIKLLKGTLKYGKVQLITRDQVRKVG